MPFEQSMGKYGNDKPDHRFDMPHTDLTDLVIEHGGGGISFFKDIADKFTAKTYRRDLPTEIVKALRVPGTVNGVALSRADIDKLEDFVKGMGSRGYPKQTGFPVQAAGWSSLHNAPSTRLRIALKRRAVLVRSSRQAIVIEHASEDPVYGTHPSPKLHSFESYVAVPIFLRNGDYFGNVCALDATPT